MGRSNMWVSFLPKRRPEADWAPEDAYGGDAQRRSEEEDWEDQAADVARDFNVPDIGVPSIEATEDDQQAEG